MMSPTIQLYLSRFAIRQRRVVAIRAIGFAMAAFLGWMLVCCWADMALQLSRLTRAILLSIDVAVALILIALPLWRLIGWRDNWPRIAADVERRTNRFEQRLQTVVGQGLLPAEQRGSADLLRSIVHQVEHDLMLEPANRIVPAWRLAVPWLTCAVVGLLVAASAVALRDRWRPLVLRFTKPWSAVAPITKTLLKIEPGDVSIEQNSPLTVGTIAAGLNGDVPAIAWTVDGRAWTTEPMNAVAGASNQFLYSFTGVDRAFSYIIKGGDAVSPTYHVVVNRRPAVMAFHVRYDYPAYTHKPPINLSNGDGIFEVPAGSQAIIEVVATEPLSSARLYVGDTSVTLDRTVNPAIWQCRIVTAHDSPLRLELKATNTLAGSGPAGMHVKALPDQEPVVQLIQPAADLWLKRNDILPIECRATDDYGVTYMLIHARINSTASYEWPIAADGDPRYQSISVSLNLATIPSLGNGDVVELSLLAGDGAGHRVSSEVRTITISPKSIDMKAYLRLADLQETVRLTDTMANDLGVAAAAAADARDIPTLDSIRQRVVDASESNNALRVALLRAIVNSQSPRMSMALAQWADDGVSAATLAKAAAQRLGTASQEQSRDGLARAAQIVSSAREQLAVVAAGELATMALAEHENMQATGLSGQSKELIQSKLKHLGFGEWSSSLEADLTAKVRAGDGMVAAVAGVGPVDYAAAVPSWWTSLATTDGDDIPRLGERLSIASQCEVVRSDADLVRARDWQLAGRAAKAFADSAPAAASPAQGEQFASAIGALQQDHWLNRDSSTGRDVTEMRTIRAAADDARSRLEDWARAASASPEDDPAVVGQMQEALFLRASVETAQGLYDQAVSSDAAALRLSATRPAAGSETSSHEFELQAARQRVGRRIEYARHLDQLRQRQSQLQQQTRTGKSNAKDFANAQAAITQTVKTLMAENPNELHPPLNATEPITPTEAIYLADPIAAAGAFSKLASQDLAQSDTGSALLHQQRASDALNSAWEQSVHDAARSRLRQLGRYLPIFEIGDFESGVTLGPATASSEGRQSPNHSRVGLANDGNSIDSGARELTVPGYDDALKAYFQVLNQTRQEPASDGH
jgi:hypothetical protein